MINECAFAFGEGIGSAADIDAGMMLGLSYPRGPLAWADEIGLDHVLAVLDALWEEYREERYRPRRPASGARGLGRAARSTQRRRDFYATERPAEPRAVAAVGAHCASAKSPTGIPSGVGTCGVSRRYHSASSAAWQPEPAAVIAWR